MGRLDVRIVEARNIPDIETFGKPDPYVIMKLETQVQRTSVQKSTYHPKWEEVFKFTVADENSSQLHFEVWNKNLVSDDFIGKYSLSLSGLVRAEVRDEWILLQQCKAQAELRIRVMALDFGRQPANAPTSPATVPPQATPQAPPQYQQQQYATQQPQYAPPPQPAPYPQQQAYPQQAYPQQAYPPQSYPPQAYPQQPYAQSAYPQQSYAPQGYPPQQVYPPQGYPQQNYPPQQSYPTQQGYPTAYGYGQPNYAQGYPPQQGPY